MENIVRRVILTIAIIMLATGCYVFCDWRDYIPIAIIPLQEDVVNYTFYFDQNRSGDHYLGFRLIGGEDNVPLNLSFSGEIVLSSCDGSEYSIPFKKHYGEVMTLFLYTNIPIAWFRIKKCHCGKCIGRVNLHIDGDINSLLEKHPQCRILVKYNELG